MIPPILYKYRDDSLRTEELIVNRKVWLSTPEKLNDPLECKTGVLPEDWKLRIIRQMEDAQILGVYGLPMRQPKTIFSYDEQATRKWFKRFRKLPRDRRIRAMRKLYADHGVMLSDPKKIFSKLQSQTSSVGIFSLSECSDNQPMWAHYAANHTGLALGFATNRGGKIADPKHTWPVTYSDEKPVFKDGFSTKLVIHQTSDGHLSENSISFDDPVFRASISTKSPFWGYEHEWRYVEQSSGLFDFPGPLIQIIYGIRMPKVRRDHFTALIKKLGYPIEHLEVCVSPEGKFKIGQLA